MLKRMYIVISLLSMASIMQGMEDEIGKRSALGKLDSTLDILVGKVEEEVSAHAGTITTVEHELGVIAQEAKDELTLLGVTPKGAYDAAVVFGALYLTAETAKYIYHRYIAPQEQPLDAATLAAGKFATDANNNVHVLGQFVSTTQVQAIVEAKWKEMLAGSKLADKDYVDTATAQIRNMATSALETTASRVKVLEQDLGGLKIILRGDPKAITPGLLNRIDILANRVVALENQKQSASSSAKSKEKEKSGGMLGGMFRRKKGSDSAVHGIGQNHGDNHSNGAHDDDEDDDGANITDLQAHSSNNNNNNINNNDTL